MYASLVSRAKIKHSRSWPSRPAAVTSPILWWGHNNIMVRSQHLKDTTTQHITTHMHGYKKQNKKKVYHLITACMCVGIYSLVFVTGNYQTHHRWCDRNLLWVTVDIGYSCNDDGFVLNPCLLQVGLVYCDGGTAVTQHLVSGHILTSIWN